jgi:hypothetical protein
VLTQLTVINELKKICERRMVKNNINLSFNSIRYLHGSVKPVDLVLHRTLQQTADGLFEFAGKLALQLIAQVL